MTRLSIIIITKNEEENLPRCLESVKWADEVVIVDSHSTDRTAEIAAKYGCKIFTRDWPGYGAAKQFALEQATGEWVLSLDADEAVSNELHSEIAGLLQRPDLCDAYYIPRRTNFLGRWILHCGWYPDYLIRLFKRTHGRFDLAVVHEGVVVEGTTGKLRHDLLHFSYPTLEKYFQKFNRYTTLGAQEALRNGKRAGWFDIVMRPPVCFVKHYVTKRGFLDGLEGFVLSALSATAVLVKYAKLWQLTRKTSGVKTTV